MAQPEIGPVARDEMQLYVLTRLPRHEVAQPVDAARSNEDVERGAACLRDEQVGLDVVYGDFGNVLIFLHRLLDCSSYRCRYFVLSAIRHTEV